MVALEILGQSHDRDYLWVSFDGSEPIPITDIALAVARRTFQRDEYEQPTLRGHPVDEEIVTLLINALDAPQPFWPPLICRVDNCGTEAQVMFEDNPYCKTHGSNAIEASAWAAARQAMEGQ